MDFWELTKLLLRRWYVAVPLLLLTLGSAGWTWFYVTPDYKTVAYVQLIPPSLPAPTSPNQLPEQLRNPWVELGLESLNAAASVTTVNATFLETLVDQGLSDNITITQGYPNPIAQIEVVGSTKEQTLATADVVTARYIDIVAALQTDRKVRPTHMITTFRLNTGPSLEETGGKVKRAVLAVGAAGLLLTAALTVGFDAFVRRRQRRRAERGLGLGGPAEQPAGTGAPRRRSSLFADEGEFGSGPAMGTTARAGTGGRGRAGRPASPSARSTNSYQIPTYMMPADSSLTPAPPSGAPATDGAAPEPVGDQTLPIPPDATIVLPLSHTPRRPKKTDKIQPDQPGGGGPNR